jgi:hypothetical protein
MIEEAEDEGEIAGLFLLGVVGCISTNFISEMIVPVDVCMGPMVGVRDASKCKAVGDSDLK